LVGLGNYGEKYQGTRHNIGFMVLDRVAARLNDQKSFELKEASSKGTYEQWFDEQFGFGIFLIKPWTYMNRSGVALQKVFENEKLSVKEDLSNWLVICDDVELPFGYLRLRTKGSAGSHNGLSSIVEHMSEDFSRLRIGVGRGSKENNLADFVLGPFTGQEKKYLDLFVDYAASAAIEFFQEKIEIVMAKYNGQYLER